MDDMNITTDGLGDRSSLWAPWRMEYLEGLGENHCGCFLCKYRDEPENDAEHLVVLRAEKAFVVLNRFPYTGGHCLIAPYDHKGDLTDLDEATLAEIMHLMRDMQKVIRHAIGPHGFNVGMNLGRCAGAGLPDHLHAHIVPRWEGDTNFMPVLGQAHVIPEFLLKTRDKLVASAHEIGLGELYDLRD